MDGYPRPRNFAEWWRIIFEGRKPADAVIALTDVYTGTDDFTDAADAKAKMRA